jgi:hypothetical protein
VIVAEAARASVAEEAHVEHRPGCVRFPRREQSEEHEPDDETGEHVGRDPAVVRHLDDREQESDQPGDRQDGADRIERALLGRARVRDETPREREGERAHRDVDEEHGSPAQVLDEQAPDDRADRDADAGYPCPHADGPGALGGITERVGEN